jgi:hypothetical protein
MGVAIPLDLTYHLTGASVDNGSQTTPNLSLGGYRSSALVVDSGLNNLFDDISASQRLIEYTDYRCFCVKNTDGVNSMTNLKVWMEEPDFSVIGVLASLCLELPTGDLSTGYAQTIANESSSPILGINTTGSWVAPLTKATGATLEINGHGADLGPNEIFFIWVKRSTDAPPALLGIHDFTIFVEGDLF